MLCGYYNCLDSNIDNINAQPHENLNQVKSRLEENWEYIGYDLFYWVYLMTSECVVES